MIRKFVIYFSLTVILSFLYLAAAAMPVTNFPADTVMQAGADMSQRDSLVVQETVEENLDSLYNQYNQSQKQDTVVVFERGYDVSRYVNVRRQRAADVTPFRKGSFTDNTFLSLRAVAIKLMPEDYSFGSGAGLSVGKWFHQDHAVRLDLDYARWNDNLDGAPINDIEVGASYLFNLSSYVGGYRTSRLCEVSMVAGVGYSNNRLLRTSESGDANTLMGHAFNGHVGLNLNLRIFKDISLFVEPLASIYTNGVALYHTGNWRRWMASFKGSAGLTYNIRQSYAGDSPRLLPRNDGWFVGVMGGPHFQNSDLVYNEVGLREALGVHVGLSVGKYYTGYFAFRYTAAYSRGTWVQYEDDEMPCNYFSVRAEGMLDMVGLIRKAMGRSEDRALFAVSVLFGPEIGYMYKVDKSLVINTPYIGLTGGVQAKCNLTDRLSLFIEPRFLVLPYDAPSHDETVANDFRNYYDGIFNANFGIEFML